MDQTIRPRGPRRTSPIEELEIDRHKVQLIESGENYYSAVIDALGRAKSEIFFEAYIFADDEAGRPVAEALMAAARRKVRTHLLIDGLGSIALPEDFIQNLRAAGIQVLIFKPMRKLWGLDFRTIHRLHRKIVTIDGHMAFIGGMNVCRDHLRLAGSSALFDYAVSIEGPYAQSIHAFSEVFFARESKLWTRLLRWSRFTLGRSREPLRLIVRDNWLHRRSIENEYIQAIDQASEEVMIAVAYFLPGYRFLKSLIRAANRKVAVKLILQGKSEFQLLSIAASALFPRLLEAGVEIYHYDSRLLHAKVALVDRSWTTIGSCNLDPFSLALNLEANLVIADPRFAQLLKSHLEELIAHDCSKMEAPLLSHTLDKLLRNAVYYIVRGIARLLIWVGNKAGI